MTTLPFIPPFCVFAHVIRLQPLRRTSEEVDDDDLAYLRLEEGSHIPLPRKQPTIQRSYATRNFCKIFIRACTVLRRPAVCRASNLTYRQMYRQVVQPIDRESVCKLFNALHVVLDQLHIICVYHCMAILTFVAILMLTLISVAIYISEFFLFICMELIKYKCIHVYHCVAI
jgi:hypothetical protein